MNVNEVTDDFIKFAKQNYGVAYRRFLNKVESNADLSVVLEAQKKVLDALKVLDYHKVVKKSFVVPTILRIVRITCRR